MDGAGSRWTSLLLEPGGEEEGRTLAGLALHADLPAHHLHELLGDRQPEAGAAEPARRGAVGLRERLEEPRLHVGGDANAGVLDGEA